MLSYLFLLHDLKCLQPKVPSYKLQLYNQVLQRYLTFYNRTSTKQPMTVKLLQGPDIHNAPPEDRDDDAQDHPHQAPNVGNDTYRSQPHHSTTKEIHFFNLGNSLQLRKKPFPSHDNFFI